MAVTGLSETLAALRQIEQDLGRGGEVERRLDAVLHDAVIEGLRARQERIPEDTGALKKSLVRKSDRAHVWESDGRGGFNLGSTLPQALYQGHRIPAPDETVVLKHVEDDVSRFIDDALR